MSKPRKAASSVEGAPESDRDVEDSETSIDGLAEDLAALQSGTVGIYRMPDRESGPGSPRFCFAATIGGGVDALFELQQRAATHGPGEYVIWQRDPATGRLRTVGRFGIDAVSAPTPALEGNTESRLRAELEALRMQVAQQRPSSDLAGLLQPLVPDLMKLAGSWMTSRRADPVEMLLKGMELARAQAVPAAPPAPDSLTMLDRLLDVKAKLQESLGDETPADMGTEVLRMLSKILPSALTAPDLAATPVAVASPSPAGPAIAQEARPMIPKNPVHDALDTLLAAAAQDRDPMVYAAIAVDQSESDPALRAELEALAAAPFAQAFARLGTLHPGYTGAAVESWTSRLHHELRAELGIDAPAG